MKNLFKNLMLVAVAAMAFTACSEDNNEVNNVERVTRYEFTAEIADDTRSGFAEKEDGATAYKSEWYGNETLKLFLQTNDQSWSAETTASIDEEGVFSFELENAPESFFMTVCSPVESWSAMYSSTIPTEQTPLANSVDPKAHLLQAQGIYVSNGIANEINLGHQAAYGKMTVNGVDFAIDHVVVDFKGSYYNNSRELSYTINADNVEGNTFWFATEPIDVAEFTVTAYDAEGKAVTKTVNMAGKEKPLAFSYGKVSTFSVSELKEPAVPSVPVFTSENTMYYHSNSWTYVDEYNEYYCSPSDVSFIFSSEELGTLQLNFYNTFSSFNIPAGVYDENHIYTGDGTKYSYYQPAGSSGKYQLSDVELVVAQMDNKQYNFTFNVKYNGGASEFNATYTGYIEGFDLRTPLATPNAVATVDGKMITISWDSVTGAEKYVVESNSFATIETTETTVTIEAPEYSTSYTFNIKAVAADTDPDYRSSSSKTINVTTGKDPNSFADYELDYVTVSSNYFEFNRDWNNGSANTKTSLRIYLNSSDKGSNYINPGHYNCLGQGASTPSSVGSVNLRYCTDTWQYYYSTANSSSYLDVEIVDGQYVIIATIDGKTWGYKGLPGGWIIPDVDDSGDDNTGEGGGDNTGGGSEAELGTVNNPYTFTECSVFVAQFPKLTFSGAEDGAELTLESNTGYGLPTGVITLGDNGWWSEGHSYNLGDIDYGYSYSSIDQNPDGSYTINYIMINSGGKTVFYRYSGGSVL